METTQRFMRRPEGPRVLRNQRRVQAQRIWVITRNLVLLAVVVFGATAIYQHTQSDVRFAVRDVEITGAVHTQRASVEALTQRYMGANLFRLDIARVQNDLRKLPWVRRVDVEKNLPNTLRVRITERKPAALLQRGSSLLYVDEEGVPFAQLAPAIGDDDLPLITDASGAELARVVAVLQALKTKAPEMYTRVSEVRPLPPGGVAIFDRQLRAWVYANDADLAAKWRTLYGIVAAERVTPASIRYADLRFADRVVVLPNGTSAETELQSRN